MPTEDLMYLAAAMDVVAFVPILFLRGTPVPAADREQTYVDLTNMTARTSPAPGGLRNPPPLLLIAGLAALTVLVSTLVEFQWKVGAAEELARDKARLTTYFGYFYAIVFLLTGASQLGQAILTASM